jgi:hypothetical protein
MGRFHSYFRAGTGGSGAIADAEDIVAALVDYVGADGVLVVEDDDVVSKPAFVAAAPTVYTSASNALALDYSGVIKGITTMSENTTAAFSNIDNYAEVVLEIVGHASNSYTLTFPSGTDTNLSGASRVLTVPALRTFYALINRNGSGDYIVTFSDAHVNVA